jgi:hypothetical protein
MNLFREMNKQWGIHWQMVAYYLCTFMWWDRFQQEGGDTP